jgi:NitT/TauT family transport system permease protein
MWEAIERLAFAPDPQSGDYVWWKDTWASLKADRHRRWAAPRRSRLLAGLNMGLRRWMKDLFGDFLTFVSMVPPLAVLPILFIALGVDELSKVVLIFIGVFPGDGARHAASRWRRSRASRSPRRSRSGASRWDVIYRIVMPQVIPRLVDNVRWRWAPPGSSSSPPRPSPHRGPGLPHLPHAPLPRHGRDPAVRRVDRRARLRARLVAARHRVALLRLVPGDQ